MERYNYPEAVRADVLRAILENYNPEEIREALKDRDAFAEKLNDDLWIDDSVTGNASGSYYCNTWKAEEAIAHNLDTLGEALQEFGCGPEYLIEKGAEAADVTIRCYLLNSAIGEALDELEKEYPPEPDAFDLFCDSCKSCDECKYKDCASVTECREAVEKDRATEESRNAPHPARHPRDRLRGSEDGRRERYNLI